MKVFLSWSGETSRQIAATLKDWLPCIIHNIEPYFSPADIEKGARWCVDLSRELQNTSYGILCVTKDNLTSAWLNFEAGALSKHLGTSKVCPLLVDILPSDIPDSPILQFQMAKTTRDDVFKLFDSLNKELGENSLDDKRLLIMFDTFWPNLEGAFRETKRKTSFPEHKSDNNNNKIDEVLVLVREQMKLLNRLDQEQFLGLPRAPLSIGAHDFDELYYNLSSINEHSSQIITSEEIENNCVLFDHAYEIKNLSQQAMHMVKIWKSMSYQ